MRAITKRCSFRFRSNPRERSSVQDQRQLGFALIVMMIAVTVLTIGLLMVLPSIEQEARREHEEELLFRGNQYARAIYLFQQRYNRYPNSIKELIHTDNLSFLRKPWPDPMTPGGKWRFIHVSGNGALMDSWTMGPQMNNGQGNTNALGSFSNSSGSTSSGGFGGQSGFGGSSGVGGSSSFGGSSGFGSSGGFGGSSGFGGSNAGMSSTAGMGAGSQGGFDWPSGGSSGFAGSSTASSGFGSGFGSSGNSGFGSSSSASSFGASSSSTTGSSTTGSTPGNASTAALSSEPGRPRDSSGKPKQSPDCQGTGTKPLNPESLYSAGSSSSMEGFALNNGTQGLALAGVASCSDQKALRTWNKHKVYSEWEFLGVGFSAGGAGGPVQATAPTAGLPGMTGGQSNQGGFGSSGGFGQQGNTGFGQQGNTGFGQTNGGFGGSTGFGNQGNQQGNQTLYPAGQPAEPPTPDNPPNNPPDNSGDMGQPQPPDNSQPPL